MSGDFIDSNVFVYLFDETDERKRATSERIVESALQTKSGSISFQVVQETLNVFTPGTWVLLWKDKRARLSPRFRWATFLFISADQTVQRLAPCRMATALNPVAGTGFLSKQKIYRRALPS